MTEHDTRRMTYAQRGFYRAAEALESAATEVRLLGDEFLATIMEARARDCRRQYDELQRRRT